MKRDELKAQAEVKALQGAIRDKEELERIKLERSSYESRNKIRDELQKERSTLRTERFKANNPIISRAIENAKKLKEKNATNTNPLYFKNQKDTGNVFTQAGSAASGGIPGLTAPAKPIGNLKGTIKKRR